MFVRTCSLALVAALGLLSRGAAAEPKSSLSQLSLEVAALQGLHRFRMTPAQMESLRSLARDTAAAESAREPGKGSGKLRQTLRELREALLRGEQDDIDTLEEKLADLLDAEDSDLDDDVEITAGARRRVNECLSSLSPKQVLSFLDDPGEELPDPLERLLLTIPAAGKLKEDDWKLLAEETVKELSWQLGGLDAERNKWVGKRVEGFLTNLRSLKAGERKRQQAEQEKWARDFVANVPPTQILHHFTQRALAELLSNPRLVTALDARLKK